MKTQIEVAIETNLIPRSEVEAVLNEDERTTCILDFVGGVFKVRFWTERDPELVEAEFEFNDVEIHGIEILFQA